MNTVVKGGRLMKALILKEYGRFAFEETAMPAFGSEDVLVKVKACAICGSDVHGMDGSTGRRIPPVIMGHEASGIIHSVGDGVRNYSVGDRVTFDSTIYCGRCSYCRQGRINLCDNRRVLGVSCEEYRRDGALAEYVAVPERILYKLPDEVSFERAAMIEPLSIALHAVKVSGARMGDTAAVIGTGMIGLLAVQVLKLTACRRVIAVDMEQSKLELALKFGATDVINASKTNPVEEIMKITGNRGVDASFEVVGLSQTVRTAAASVKKGGKLTLVGNLSADVQFPLQSIVTREVQVSGSCASSGEYDVCLDLIARGCVDVDSFISAAAPLSEGAGWFARLYAKEAGLMKVILKP